VCLHNPGPRAPAGGSQAAGRGDQLLPARSPQEKLRGAADNCRGVPLASIRVLARDQSPRRCRPRRADEWLVVPNGRGCSLRRWPR
jgi:hypothetical protein